MRMIVAAMALSLGVAISTTAFAAGESSSESTKSDTKQQPVSPKKLNCKKGEVIKTVKNKEGKQVKACIKADAGILPDDELYEQGRLLAKEGEYDWALDVLAMIKDQNNPKVLNYTGYSHRKAGRIEVGITYYRKALSINPDFVLAREYLGEGYVAAGRIDLARVELGEIAKLCGETCEEYKDLKTAIDTAIN